MRGCAVTAGYPEVRSDLHDANSFRTAPSLCADMIFGKDNELFNDLGPSSPRQFYLDCIIATRGYDFREGQPAFSRQESPFCLSLRLDAPRRRRFQLIHSYLDKGIEHCPCSL